jgi:hypothetical protein
MFAHAREHEHDSSVPDRPVDLARRAAELSDGSFLVVPVEGLRVRLAAALRGHDFRDAPDVILAVLGVGEMEGDA